MEELYYALYKPSWLSFLFISEQLFIFSSYAKPYSERYLMIRCFYKIMW
jgi:hypothetical protein